MSQEFTLVTRQRPSRDAFLQAVRAASAQAVPEASAQAGGSAGSGPEIDGDFGNPNGYVNVAAPGLWIEIEPPGYVEAADLADEYGDLPEPDGDGCLWLTTANVPAGAPPASAATARHAFEALAAACDGVTSPA